MSEVAVDAENSEVPNGADTIQQIQQPKKFYPSASQMAAITNQKRFDEMKKADAEKRRQAKMREIANAQRKGMYPNSNAQVAVPQSQQVAYRQNSYAPVTSPAVPVSRTTNSATNSHPMTQAVPNSSQLQNYNSGANLQQHQNIPPIPSEKKKHSSGLFKFFKKSKKQNESQGFVTVGEVVNEDRHSPKPHHFQNDENYSMTNAAENSGEFNHEEYDNRRLFNNNEYPQDSLIQNQEMYDGMSRVFDSNKAAPFSAEYCCEVASPSAAFQPASAQKASRQFSPPRQQHPQQQQQQLTQNASRIDPSRNRNSYEEDSETSSSCSTCSGSSSDSDTADNRVSHRGGQMLSSYQNQQPTNYDANGDWFPSYGGRQLRPQQQPQQPEYYNARPTNRFDEQRQQQQPRHGYYSSAYDQYQQECEENEEEQYRRNYYLPPQPSHDGARDLYVDEVIPAPYKNISPKWGREGRPARRIGVPYAMGTRPPPPF